MPSISRILVPVKTLDAKLQPAAIKAAQIARACGAELQLFHVLAASVSPQGRQQAVRRLERIAAKLRAQSLKVTGTAEWDHPVHEAIVRQAVAAKADLIVLSRDDG